MTAELDRDGPAAPPRANGELVFEHPWQGRLFATTMAACEAGLVEYASFREHLIDRIAQQDASEAPDVGAAAERYWSAWQDAFEILVTDAGVIRPGDVERRAAQYEQHA